MNEFTFGAESGQHQKICFKLVPSRKLFEVCNFMSMRNDLGFFLFFLNFSLVIFSTEDWFYCRYALRIVDDFLLFKVLKVMRK